jgi:hypothetical protein
MGVRQLSGKDNCVATLLDGLGRIAKTPKALGYNSKIMHKRVKSAVEYGSVVFQINFCTFS